MAIFLGILRLVLAGKIGEAIADTQRLYPGLLESDPKLFFLLKCRQFIEMVSGVDISESNPQVLIKFNCSNRVIIMRCAICSPHRELQISNNPSSSPQKVTRNLAQILQPTSHHQLLT